MKKQLDATSLQLKLAEEERARLAQEMRTVSSNHSSTTSRVVVSSSSTTGVSSGVSSASAANPRGGGTPVPMVVTAARARGETAVNSPLYEEMAESLQREQEHTAMLRQQLQEMQLEGVGKKKI
jgi:hypothetical protein